MKQAALPSREQATLSYRVMWRQSPQYFWTPTIPMPNVCCQIIYKDYNEKVESLNMFFENYEALHLPEKLLLYKEVCNKIDIVLYHTRNTTNTWLEHQTDKIWEKFTVTIQLTKSRSSLWWRTPWIWYYCYVTDLGPFSCVWPVLVSPITLFSWC